MLRILTSFYGYNIKARDGEIGTVHEFLFDDDHWKIKHLVVKIGDWLTSRKVSIPIEVIGRPELVTTSLDINLTKQEIGNSPAVDVEQPGVFPDDYGWLGSMLPGGPAPLPLVPLSPAIEEGETSLPETETRDPNLHGTRDVVGCHVHSRNEQIGVIEDFILDDEHWRIRYLVIGTKNRLSGRHILLSPTWISKADWDENKIYVDLRSESVKQSPEYDPTLPLDREYEIRLYDYYFGRPFNNETTTVPRREQRVITMNRGRL